MLRNTSTGSDRPYPMQYPWLVENILGFPPTDLALSSPNGLLASGGDLSPPILLYAYAHGIFPWFSDDDPILWWSPEPRCVMYPNAVHVSKSLKKHLNKTPWRVTMDTCFDRVIEACAAERHNATGTWITEEMKQAYITLHTLGFAHSVEVFEEDTLIGGLYGVSLGKVFFGESMFSAKSNGSKTAIVALARWLTKHGFTLIDCQVENPHLFTLGATNLNRVDFEAYIQDDVSSDLIDQYQPLWRSYRGVELPLREGEA